MSDFIRRSFLSGQTDKVILSQPAIFGTAHVNLAGDFDDMPSSGTVELAVETESTSGSPVAQRWDAAADDMSLAGLVAAINDSGSALYPYVEASAYEGVLHIASKQTGFISAGVPAFLTVHPQTSGSLVADLAPIVGYARYPHPTATVRAGDLASSSVRAMTQGNRPSSVFIARGEDRTGENFNRALHRLALNLDNHQVKLVREVAAPVVLEIPEGSARFRVDSVTDQILGVQLTADFSDSLDAILETGIYIGGPSHDAAITEIAKFYSVLDAEWNEISVVSHDDPTPGDVKDTVVRVGTVAYVPLPPPSSYADSDFKLDGSSRSALLNSTTFNSYRSAFRDSANQPVKASSVITEIVDGATVVCATATFIADLVEAGDIAVISSSGVSSPINHDGSYIVDVVVSDTEIVLRPLDDNSLQLLNTEGLGNIEIRPNGEFETRLYLGFEPPLPRIPSGGIKLVLGMEDGFGDLPRDFMLVPAINSAEEVDGWVLKNLFRAHNLQGVYDGQGQGGGSGFHADVTHRPISLHSTAGTDPAGPARSGITGTMQDGSNWLTVGTGTGFTLADVGCSFSFTLGGTDYHDWRITRLIDARTVELAPPPHQVGTILGTGAVSAGQVFTDLLPDFQAAISSITDAPQRGGFHHTKVNDGTESSDLSFAHFEHVTEFEAFGTDYSSSSPPTALTLSATISKGDKLDFASTNIDDCPSIYPTVAHVSSRRADNLRGGVSFVKILTGTDAGLYQVYSTRPSGSGSRVQILNLDGTTPSLTDGAQDVAFYTLRMGVGVPLFGGDPAAGRAGLSVFEDGIQKGGAAYALRAGWAGPGAGLLITANDSSFEALLPTAGDVGAVGPAIKLVTYAPAYGVDVEVRGDSSSATASNRGQYGVRVLAETYAHDMSQADSTWNDGLRGGAVQGVQEGLDPAGTFIRRAGGNGNPDMLFPAALYVASLGDIDHVGAATGMTLEGDLFLPGHQSSGIYTGGTGTFNELRPGYTDLAVDPPTFWGDGAAWLGSPYLVADVATVTVSDPDFAQFNFHHSFVVDLTTADAPQLEARAPTEIVHMGVRLDLSGTPFGGTILGVWDDGAGTYRMAVLAQNGTSHTTGTHDLKAYGRRWFYSYLDIANYSEIGTGVIAPFQDPGSSQTDYQVSTSSYLSAMPDIDQEQDGAGGLRPLITYDFGDGSSGPTGFNYGKLKLGNPDTSSLGDLLSLFSFGQRSGEALADYSTAVASNDARDRDAWRNLSAALTSAIDGHVSAQAEIGGPAPFVLGQVPTARDSLKYEMFWDADSAFTSAHVEVVPNDGVQKFGSWGASGVGPHFAGGGPKIVISRDRGDADIGYVYLYLKLANSIIEGNLAFRVLVDALQYSLGSRNMLVEIVEGTGSSAPVLASKVISVPVGTTYDRYVVDFLEWQPAEEQSRTSGDVFLRISTYLAGGSISETDADRFMGDYGTVPPLWYLRGMNVHALEQALIKGNLALQGVLRAAGLRAHTPIMGHAVVGPAGVRQLEESGYRWERGSTSASSFTRVRSSGSGDQAYFPKLATATTYAPLADESGSQEGSGVGTLPIFELIDSQDELGEEISSAAATLRISGPTGMPSVGQAVWAGIADAREIPLSVDTVNVMAGYWRAVGTGSVHMAYDAGEYSLSCYIGTDFYGGINTFTPGVSNEAGAVSRWAYAGYAIPYLSFTAGTRYEFDYSATNNPTTAADSDVVIALGNVGSAVRYYRPSYDGSRFFKVGRNAAAIDGYHPYFDPFFYWWYCFQSAVNRLSFMDRWTLRTFFGGDANFWTDVDPETVGSFQRDPESADASVNPDFWDMPGMTGFIGELSPPHGSLLTRLEVSLSFKSADGRYLSSANTGAYQPYKRWGVWRSAPTKDAPRSEWVDEDNWDARQGVVVRLWRYSLYGDFGRQPENTTNTEGSGFAAQRGFAELIAETELDLSGEDVGDPDEESFFDVVVDAPSSALTRVVDGRRYAYFFTVEFFIGCRRNIEGDLTIPGLSSSDSEQAQRTSPLTWTTAFPDLWPTALGQFGEYRTDTAKGYHKAVSWEGHLVRRRSLGETDAKSVILPGQAYYDGATTSSTFSWDPTSKVTSMSGLAPGGFQIFRSVYDASAFISAAADGSGEGYTLVLPYAIPQAAVHSDSDLGTVTTDDPTEWMTLPLDATDRADSDPATPEVKFRGARLSWVTDRLSDGGW